MHPSEYFPSQIEVRKLSSALNPHADQRVEIYAVLAGANIKMYPALSMLSLAKARGELEGVHTLVENSSGNMALALGLLAPRFGVKKVVAIVPADSPSGKLDPIRLTRIKPEFHTESEGELSGIALAAHMGTQAGWFNLAQYQNEEGNSGGTYRWVAPEVAARLSRLPQVICAGIGTGGTIIGFSRYFKERAPNTHVIGVRVAPHAAVPGVRSEKRLLEVKNRFREAADEIVDIGTKESYLLSRALWWDIGCHVGPSSGFALAGLRAGLDRMIQDGSIERLRNGDGIVRAVFVCPDMAYPYWDKYSTILDAKDLE